MVNADQTVILWWDRANQTEHFIRRASFRGGGDSVGFLVPSPGRPQLEESGDEAFPYLANLTRPASSGGGFPIGCSVAAPIANREVRVIERTTVAGYDAVVLTAGSGDALLKWLTSNGFAFRPETAAWAEPYVKNGWYISAMKTAKTQTAGEKSTTASALRITFKTDKPLFPYREPDSRSDASQLGIKNRILRIYFVAEAPYEGRFPTGKPWPADVRYSSPLEEAERTRLIQMLGLAPSAGPSKAWLTEFEHHWPYGIAPGDVYFTPSAKSTKMRRASAGLSSDPTLIILCGCVLFPALRRATVRMKERPADFLLFGCVASLARHLRLPAILLVSIRKPVNSEPMKKAAHSDSLAGSLDRQKHLREALGNAALEGIKPHPQALSDLQAVIGGTLTNDQYRQRVKQRYGLPG